MILVSHSPEEITKICDRLLILRNGEVSFLGEIGEIEKDKIGDYY